MGRYVNFDRDAYIWNLRSAILEALQRVETKIHLAMVRNLAGLRMREIDAKYRADMVASIRTATYNMANYLVGLYLGAAGGSKPNESFRAMYYEFGTGSKMEPPSHWSPGGADWNPARPAHKGAAIYQRPYGEWYDQGGNRHFARTKGRPKPIPKRHPYGQEIEPQFWFRKAVWEGTASLDEEIIRAVKSVPIAAYIRLREIRK